MRPVHHQQQNKSLGCFSGSPSHCWLSSLVSPCPGFLHSTLSDLCDVQVRLLCKFVMYVSVRVFYFIPSGLCECPKYSNTQRVL